MRLGYGVYGRAVVCASFRRADPLQPERVSGRGAASPHQAWREHGSPSEAERDYNAGRSTQIPLKKLPRVERHILGLHPILVVF